jgi:hypothetical protein
MQELEEADQERIRAAFANPPGRKASGKKKKGEAEGAEEGQAPPGPEADPAKATGQPPAAKGTKASKATGKVGVHGSFQWVCMEASSGHLLPLAARLRAGWSEACSSDASMQAWRADVPIPYIALEHGWH